MTRVLHYGMSPNLGGIETYLLNLARSVDSERFSFDFLYSDQGARPVFADELEPRGSRFYGVTPRRTSPRRNRQDLDRLFSEEQFDILHFHANTASYVEPVRAALRHGVRVVVHSHNAGASRSRLTRALHAWHRRTLPWDRITRVAVSNEAGRWMFGDRPFEVLHNGIDVDRFAFDPEARRVVREALGLRSDAFVVGSIAAFLPAKNHEFLVRVFAEVAQRDAGARLLLVGDGPMMNTVQEQVGLLGLADRVLFLGRRTDVPNLLSTMDTMLMPSLHEGFPLVTVEAQTSGLSCVLSDAITGEVVISPRCVRLPLEAGTSVWADRLLNERDLPRNAIDPHTVDEAGLSVSRAAARVEKIYDEVAASGSHP